VQNSVTRCATVGDVTCYMKQSWQLATLRKMLLAISLTAVTNEPSGCTSDVVCGIVSHTRLNTKCATLFAGQLLHAR
jgi:hypothetical protein